jgi:alcohol dehydrogenase (cytochrome c)
MDEVFESVLIDIEGRKSLFKMGKLGFSGSSIERPARSFAPPISAIRTSSTSTRDRQGHVPPGKIPQLGVRDRVSAPSTAGFKSWRAMAFSPQTNALYIPMNSQLRECDVRPDERSRRRRRHGPGCAARHQASAVGGNLGEFLALDVTSGKVLWRHRTPSPSNTAALTTAGGLVFGGDWDRHMYAYDAATGKSCGRRACRRPHRDFRSPISRTASSTWRCRRASAAAAGPHSFAPELAPENSAAKLRQLVARLRAANGAR